VIILTPWSELVLDEKLPGIWHSPGLKSGATLSWATKSTLKGKGEYNMRRKTRFLSTVTAMTLLLALTLALVSVGVGAAGHVETVIAYDPGNVSIIL
jgi:hypothetical protein